MSNPRVASIYEFSNHPLPEFEASLELPNRSDCDRFVDTVRGVINHHKDTWTSYTHTYEAGNQTLSTRSEFWLPDGLLTVDYITSRPGTDSEFDLLQIDVDISVLDEGDETFNTWRVFGLELKTAIPAIDEADSVLDERYLFPILRDYGIEQSSDAPEHSDFIGAQRLLGKTEPTEHIVLPGVELEEGEYEHAKERVEGIYRMLADVGSLRDQADLVENYVEQRVANSKTARVSKQTLNRVSDLLEQLYLGSEVNVFQRNQFVDMVRQFATEEDTRFGEYVQGLTTDPTFQFFAEAAGIELGDEQPELLVAQRYESHYNVGDMRVVVARSMGILVDLPTSETFNVAVTTFGPGTLSTLNKTQFTQEYIVEIVGDKVKLRFEDWFIERVTTPDKSVVYDSRIGSSSIPTPTSEQDKDENITQLRHRLSEGREQRQIAETAGAHSFTVGRFREVMSLLANLAHN